MLHVPYGKHGYYGLKFFLSILTDFGSVFQDPPPSFLSLRLPHSSCGHIYSEDPLRVSFYKLFHFQQLTSHYFSISKMTETIPGPPGLPFLGNINDIDPADGISSLGRLADTYGMFN